MMIIYTSNEKFTVLMDTSTYLYYLQMAGCEVEDKAYNIAAEAIEEGVSR